MSTWRSVLLCRKCKTELTFNQVMGNFGICPFCGNVKEGTVVDATKTSKRWVVDKKYPWYRFKKNKGHWEYKK